MTTPWNGPFVPILGVITVCLYCGRARLQDSVFWYASVVTCAAMGFNVCVQSEWAQQWFHDLFVYIVVSGMPHTQCVASRNLASAVVSAMLVTRATYNRCLALWWNEERNTDIDLIVAIMLCVGLIRGRRPLLSRATCAFIGLASHWIRDDPSEQTLAFSWSS